MPDFFRKERDNIFLDRFKQDKGSGLWAYKAAPGLIFRAKKDTRTFKLKGTDIDVTCESTIGCTLIFTYKQKGKSFKVTLTEAQMAAALDKNSPLAKEKPIVALAAAEVCRLHATASTNSVLISGCVVDNFQASTAYPGRKMHLILNAGRVPFANPAVSGNEKEYFLIRQVTSADCDKVLYLGQSHEDLEQEIAPL